MKIYKLTYKDDFGIENPFAIGTLRECVSKFKEWYSEHIEQFDEEDLDDLPRTYPELKLFLNHPFKLMKGKNYIEDFYSDFSIELIYKKK